MLWHHRVAVDCGAASAADPAAKSSDSAVPATSTTQPAAQSAISADAARNLGNGSVLAVRGKSELLRYLGGMSRHYISRDVWPAWCVVQWGHVVGSVRAQFATEPKRK